MTGHLRVKQQLHVISALMARAQSDLTPHAPRFHPAWLGSTHLNV